MKNLNQKRQIIFPLLWAIFAGLGSVLVIAASLYLYLSPKLPPVETLKEVKFQTPLRIFSQDSKLIGEFGEKRRSPVTYDEIPPLFIKAVLAAEDDRFYSHNGVDFKGLMRAGVQLLQKGRISGGGSTITMQVARNFFLTLDQTFTRKFNEILLSLRIEEELSKNEILTLYANKMYMGNRAYGIEAAAQVYYGKAIDELSLAQLAMIAATYQLPSRVNPINNPERSLIRRNWILGRMHKLGYIDEALYQQAKNEGITANFHGYAAELEASYIAEMARQEAISLFGPSIYSEGYRIYTTIEGNLQQAAVEAVRKGIHNYDWRHGYRGPERKALAQEAWQDALSKATTIGTLEPAIVTAVSDTVVDLLLKDGLTGQLLWENGLDGLRLFIDEDRQSAPIKSATELVSVGDLIRVSQLNTPAAESPLAESQPIENQPTDKQLSQNQEGQTLSTAWQLRQTPRAQGALVALAPEDGAIKALVGGYNFRQSHFNRVTQAERQPGSNFKPFIYTTALENGFTAASVINDAPVVFQDKQLESVWRPENDSGKFYGPTRLRQALYLSRNLISIRLLRSLGVNTTLDGVERFGFDRSALPRDLSLSLGSHAVTPLKVATGYAALANGGFQVEPYLISHIEDLNGTIIYQASPLTVCADCEELSASEPSDDITEASLTIADQLNLDDLSTELGLPDRESEGDSEQTDQALLSAENQLEESLSGELATLEQPPLPNAPRIIDERVVYIMDSVLKDVIKKGTGTKAKSLKRADIAGKTGTTNGPRDAWFSGYSPHMVATAWLGFDQNLLLGRGEYGGSAALPIWIDFMAEALRGKPEILPPQPQGLVTVKIDPATGQRIAPDAQGGIFEIFRKEYVPPLQTSGATNIDTGDSAVLPEEIF